ncbi:hypothetical protein CFI10_11550 [Marinobacterium iners]|uniref:hypothetical protein n=1 Tax=Marinobacterium iners TaxID=48076 RepID=UPI001A8E8AD2|nr:hypothetical protein [Marinobacterium iners]QSR35624.1 hypothetical protein CFI10_11550 [Marinobacterium iners]
MFSEEYRLLSQEAHLAKSALLSGMDSLRKANLDDKGLFYSGLFQLSIGFERLLKLVVILHHKSENKHRYPSNKELKDYGHDINQLYQKSVEIGKTYLPHTDMQADDIQAEIINVLSQFGKGSRYYNLDVLTQDNKNEDPLALWKEVIDSHLWELRPSVREQLQINAGNYVDKWNLHSNYSQERHLDGGFMTVFEFHYYYTGIEKVSPRIIWTIITILNPFYFLLQSLVERLFDLEDELGIESRIPHLYEFFPFFLCFKEQVLKKKQWSWKR